MLPFATRTIAETLIWTFLAIYILSRAAGIDTTTITQLSTEQAQIFLETLINSPYCLAYEEIIVTNHEIDGKIDTVNEQHLIRGGVIDIRKIYDAGHQNCLRKSEVWDNGRNLQWAEGAASRTCGWSWWGIFDWNDDCGADYVCKSNTCVSKENNDIKPSEGIFITYNITLKNDDNGEEYSFISFEQGSRLIYQPKLRNNNLGAWASKYFDEYLTCESNFGGRIVQAETPVIIQYATTQNLGTLSISMCLGEYRRIITD